MNSGQRFQRIRSFFCELAKNTLSYQSFYKKEMTPDYNNHPRNTHTNYEANQCSGLNEVKYVILHSDKCTFSNTSILLICIM